MCAPARAWSANARRLPDLLSVRRSLAGESLGVQDGNTSRSPWHSGCRQRARLAKVQTYAYHDILSALDDLEAGRIDAFMKLEPVMRWLIRDRPSLRVVQHGITDERLAVAVRTRQHGPGRRHQHRPGAVGRRGDLARLGRRWFGDQPGGHGDLGMIRLVRLFTGPDGQSHVEDGEVPLATQDAVNAVARSALASAIYFEETAAGASLDWHNDPHRRYVITLIRDGQIRDPPRADRSRLRRATSCSPRTTRAAATAGAYWRDLPWRRVYVDIPPDR